MQRNTKILISVGSLVLVGTFFRYWGPEEIRDTAEKKWCNTLGFGRYTGSWSGRGRDDGRTRELPSANAGRKESAAGNQERTANERERSEPVLHLDDPIWKTHYIAGKGEATVLIANSKPRLTGKSTFELLMDRQNGLGRERPVSFVADNGLVEEHPSTHPNRAFHIGFAEEVAEYAKTHPEESKAYFAKLERRYGR